MTRNLDNWWTRPCGGRDVLRLALPLVISTASWTVMNFIDRMFLLWHNPIAMAAAMPAGMLHFTMLCFPLGVASYINTFVAQYHGAGRSDRIGVAVWQGVRIGLLATPVFLAIAPFAASIFSLAGHDPEVACLEVIYFQVLAFGAGGTILSVGLSSFFTGRGVTRTVMVVDSSSALLNIVFDYAWIFGHWGFAQSGIEGAAWATVVSQWFKVIVYWLLINSAANRETYQLAAARRQNGDIWRRLWRYGGPSGLQLFVEIAAFTAFVMLVGRLGKEAISATTLAFNVNSVAFVPLLGLGLAVSTLVGQQQGSGRPDLAARGTWTAFWIAIAYVGGFAVLYVAAPDLFLFGHSLGTNPAEFHRLRDLTVVLLRFVAAYCLFDAMNLIFVSALKGAGDTRFILIMSLIMSPAPITIGWLGITYFGWGLLWCWCLITIWITVLGFVYLARFLQGHWQTMRVIEPSLADKEAPFAEEPIVVCSGGKHLAPGEHTGGRACAIKYTGDGSDERRD